MTFFQLVEFSDRPLIVFTFAIFSELLLITVILNNYRLTKKAGIYDSDRWPEIRKKHNALLLAALIIIIIKVSMIISANYVGEIVYFIFGKADCLDVYNIDRNTRIVGSSTIMFVCHIIEILVIIRLRAKDTYKPNTFSNVFCILLFLVSVMALLESAFIVVRFLLYTSKAKFDLPVRDTI